MALTQRIPPCSIREEGGGGKEGEREEGEGREGEKEEGERERRRRERGEGGRGRRGGKRGRLLARQSIYNLRSLYTSR